MHERQMFLRSTTDSKTLSVLLMGGTKPCITWIGVN